MTASLSDLMDEQAYRDRDDWPSKAVIACDGDGRGCVLWYEGGALDNEIRECGFHELSELGLDNAPAGISIWEGTYVWMPGGYECPADGDFVVGSASAFREPTEDEWVAIREKRSPW